VHARVARLALVVLVAGGCGGPAPRAPAPANASATPTPVAPTPVAPTPPEPWFHDKPDAYAVCAAPTAAPTVALPAPYERCEGAEVGWASPPGGNELHFHYRAFSPAVTAARRAAAPGVCCYLIWEFPRSG
jgi:hypothetical protein